MARTSHSPDTPRHRLRRAVGLVGAAGLALLGAMYWLTHEPAPRVRVLWHAEVTAEQRTSLENRYLLRNPRDPLSNGSLAYDLLDTSASNLQAIVADPRIVDTGFIERNTLVVPFDVEYGGEWMWLAHRTPGLRHAQLRAIVIVALAAMAIGGLGSDLWRAWQAARRTQRDVVARP